MRKLMWFAMGFAAACGLCAYGMDHLWVAAAGTAMVLTAVAVLAASRKRRFLLPGVALLTGILAGTLWFGSFYHFYLHPLNLLEEEPVTLTVTVSDYSYHTGWRTGVDGVAVINGKSYQIRVYVNGEEPLYPGDSLRGSFRLRRTTGKDRVSDWFQGEGIFLQAYQQGEVSVTEGEEIPCWCYPAVLRHRILELLDQLFPEDTAPFAKALLLGDSQGLDYETDTALKVSGIRHIVAVSGLHVSMLYGFLSVLTMKRRFLTPLVGLPMLVLFAAVAGFTPSVLRACLMVGLMLLAMLFNREYDSPTGLAFAVLVMLTVNPLAVTSASLQLSAGCVAGILLFSDSISGWLKVRLPGKGRLGKLFCSSISVTLSAMSLITPLSAWYFGAVSLVSPLANLLTLWVVSLLFNGIIINCLLYLLAPAAAAVLAKGLSWLIRYVLAVAEGLASLPLAAVYTQSLAILLWLVFVYFLLTIFLCGRRKNPGLLLCSGILGLCVALLVSWRVPDTAITMLDVGQGQSILMQTEGKAILVDCGGDSDEKTADIVAGTLLSRGITRLDAVILTHYDRDHSGGLPYLLTRIDTDCLFLPDTRNEWTLPEISGKKVYVWEDMELSVGAARIQIFGPVYSGMSNENSLCVLFDTENCDILITGDRSSFGEEMLLRRRALPDVDILVAGHHGAASSTSEELLQQIQPETVLISVGQDNIYGHPAPALLQRLKDYGCTVCRTDLSGTIEIRR